MFRDGLSTAGDGRLECLEVHGTEARDKASDGLQLVALRGVASPRARHTAKPQGLVYYMLVTDSICISLQIAHSLRAALSHRVHLNTCTGIYLCCYLC